MMYGFSNFTLSVLFVKRFIYTVLIIGVIFFSQHAKATCFSAQAGFVETPSVTIYPNTVKKIPFFVQYAFQYLLDTKWGALPSGVHVEEVGRESCGQLTQFNYYLVIDNLQVNQSVVGDLLVSAAYRIWTPPYSQIYVYHPGGFSFTSIPHPLSIYGIPEQQATANTEFNFNTHDKIAYYDENLQSGHPPIVGFVPVGNAPSFAELGLSFNPETLILSGVPNQAGQFDYQVVAHNDYSTAAPVNFRLNIDYNQHDKPRFRANHKLVAMTPANAFRFNLLNLLESNPGFMLSNQVSFTLDDNSVGDNLAKIAIDSNGIDLIAEPPSTLAGQILTAKITAHSNTGGDSDEVEIQLPVALDAAMKPVINEGIQLIAHAGDSMQHNLQTNIVDPAQDANLRLVIDKVEPLAPWLSVSSSEPTTLVGNVPTDATGQQYILTLHANNQKGGDSLEQVVKLNIDIDESLKPRFRDMKPKLNRVYPGQEYFHDFQQSSDIYPDYATAPYTIKFAEGYSHPDWLVIENNQLKSIGMVPDDVEQLLKIYVVINNKVGGNSEIISLNLMAMI